MHRLAMLSRALSAGLLLLPLQFVSPSVHAADANWREALGQQIDRLDKDTPGSLGVYVKRLDNGESFGHAADQPWYLSSTAKVVIAIAVLRQVDAGKLKINGQATLKDTDKVDGSGQLVWNAPGTSFTLDSLLTRMLGVSDNTAANLLIRTAGQDALDQTAADVLGKGAGKLTNFIDVRRAVYTQLHPNAARLTNQQLVEIAAAPQGPQRVEAVRRALNVPASALQAKTIEDAYARYYKSGMNTATLEGYGGMLEQLVRGKLLSAQSTERLFKYMKFGRRGEYRLEGGIPKSEMIIHKTGTQYRRACHMAVINPENNGAKAIVVATCAADMDDQREAGGIFRRVGEAVSKTALAASKP